MNDRSGPNLTAAILFVLTIILIAGVVAGGMVLLDAAFGIEEW